MYSFVDFIDKYTPCCFCNEFQIKLDFFYKKDNKNKILSSSYEDKEIKLLLYNKYFTGSTYIWINKNNKITNYFDFQDCICDNLFIDLKCELCSMNILSTESIITNDHFSSIDFKSFKIKYKDDSLYYKNNFLYKNYKERKEINLRPEKFKNYLENLIFE